MNSIRYLLLQLLAQLFTFFANVPNQQPIFFTNSIQNAVMRIDYEKRSFGYNVLNKNIDQEKITPFYADVIIYIIRLKMRETNTITFLIACDIIFFCQLSAYMQRHTHFNKCFILHHTSSHLNSNHRCSLCEGKVRNIKAKGYHSDK